MGELEFERKALVRAVERGLEEQAREVAELRLVTQGGWFQVRWDESGSATALGQLAFFAEFLEVTGLFERWVAGCPMTYTSPNAPAVVDVLGTWLLSILDGQRRYAHVTGLRGDAVAPQILGMRKIIRDESLRRALAHLAPNQPKRCSDAEWVFTLTMGNKHIVPYVLYAAKGYVSPAERTNFTESDLDLLFEALLHMFEHDHSAARGEMVVRGLYDFEHGGTQHENNAEQNKREARLGCAHAHKLFEGIKVELTDGAKLKGFSESFADYRVICEWDDKPLPAGVSLHKRHDI